MRFRNAAAGRLTGPPAVLHGKWSPPPFAPRNHVRSLTLVFAAVVAAANVAIAQTAGDRARNLAATCTSCHGTNGVSRSEIPSLAGVDSADLVRKMQDFKSGARSGTVMPQLAKGYTDEQIGLIADWFAAQKGSK